jgi:hypothetical protein
MSSKNPDSTHAETEAQAAAQVRKGKGKTITFSSKKMIINKGEDEKIIGSADPPHVILGSGKSINLLFLYREEVTEFKKK